MSKAGSDSLLKHAIQMLFASHGAGATDLPIATPALLSACCAWAMAHDQKKRGVDLGQRPKSQSAAH